MDCRFIDTPSSKFGCRPHVEGLRRSTRIVSFRADILADVRLLPTETGGRRGPTPADEFGCPIGVGTEFFDMRIDLSSTGSLSPGQSARVPMAFLRPDFVLPLLQVGSEFTLWEGKTIGHGRVVEMYAHIRPKRSR